MSAGEFSKFAHVDVLKGIGPNLLRNLLASFKAELAAHSTAFPPELSDQDCIQALTAILAIASLSDRIIEALVATQSRPPPAGPLNPKPRYAIRKGLGYWTLIFDGHEVQLKHERGIFYVAYLLTHPPEHPIHALDLIAKIPEIYRRQLGLSQVIDPTTGKPVSLQNDARIQERNLALDDAQSLRALFRKEKQLEAILDDENESEPVKAEALRELEAIAEFQRQHGRRTQDSAQHAVRAVRQAISRFHQHLLSALDRNGNPHAVLRPFAAHLEKHLLIPSARYCGPAGTRARGPLAGSFTYEPRPGIIWAD